MATEKTTKTTTKPRTTKKIDKEFEMNSKTTVAENVNTEPTLINEEPVKPTKTVVTKKQDKSNDIEHTKKYAWLAYILFFIPLLINSDSPFVRHHANEGLEINIFDALGIALLITGRLLPKSAEWIHLLAIIFTFIGFALLILTIVTKVYMIYSTLKGKEKTTPWMWDIRIIK